MKILLSLPPNLVDCFHDITGLSREEYFCTCDPVGHRLGSGGGTAWLLLQAFLNENSDAKDEMFNEWLSKEKRILIHAGGQSRRLPSYAVSGKILMPVPVFRWERGLRLSQTLLDLQLPLYRQMMEQAPDNIHTMVVSGDVYIRSTRPLPPTPDADVVCYGLWQPASVAKNHGVFVSSRRTPTVLKQMLQKPSVQMLGELQEQHYYLTDIGVWMLSDRAVNLLMQRSANGAPSSGQADGIGLNGLTRTSNFSSGLTRTANFGSGLNGLTRTMDVQEVRKSLSQSDAEKGMSDAFKGYDLYGEFGCALGTNPTTDDAELRQLRVAIVPLPDGEFYHFGTSREMISSTLAVQNLVCDQREIMHIDRKPHPSIFVQNAITDITFTEQNTNIWIENSHIPSTWHLTHDHVITGVPRNNWDITLEPGECIDVVPVGDNDYEVRRYRIDEPVNSNEVAERANLRRLFNQRREYRKENWTALAHNWQHSVFYQLDLADAANQFRQEQIPLPPPLPDHAPLMTRIHDAMFRGDSDRAFALLRDGLTDGIGQSVGIGLARTANFGSGLNGLVRTANFGSGLNGLTRTINVQEVRESPRLSDAEKVRECPRQSEAMNGLRLSVARDQIVWARSPVRIDIAGGWTDTPPYCLMEGGNVVNLAIELNGQQPIQCYVKPCSEPHIILRSIDLGATEVIETAEQLADYNKVGSPFSIPKAALTLVGFGQNLGSGLNGCAQAAYLSSGLNGHTRTMDVQEVRENPRLSDAQKEVRESPRKSDANGLKSQLEAFGCGIELTLLSAIPAGSGLGTSSILAATVLAALNDFCGIGWDKNEIGHQTLMLEQLLTTGGGWQDQFGGILGGIKLLQTGPGFNQSPQVRWLPDTLFTRPEYAQCHLLYYTGITRTAKKILAEIVRRMFLNEHDQLLLLRKMKQHTLDMYEAILQQDFWQMGLLVRRTWQQNQLLDSGTNPAEIAALTALIDDLCLGYKLPGAGGGGYLYMVAKDPEAATRIKTILNENRRNANARFVDMTLSTEGLQISRS